MLCNINASCVLAGGSSAITEGGGTGHEDVRGGLGGAVGLRATGLLGLGGALVLPLPSSGPAFLLASLETGHQCHFSALQDAN
jgi:hypothetical protein